jgi:hypothetical protein
MQFNSIDMGSTLPGIDEIYGTLETPGFSQLMDRMTDGIINCRHGTAFAVDK